MFGLRSLSRTSSFRSKQRKRHQYKKWSGKSQRRSWRRYTTQGENPPKRDDGGVIDEDSQTATKPNGFNPLLPIAVLGAAAVATILAYLPPFSNKPLNVKKETLKKLDNIYKQYASITIGDEKYMTKEDFKASINLTGDNGKGKNGKRKAKKPALETEGNDDDPFNTLFRPRGSSGEKTITFSEFVFFDTLLATSEKEFETAFRLFDTEGDGYCSKDEFRSLMRACGHLTFAFTSGYWDNFFGEHGENRISLEDFKKLIADLKNGLLQQEFSQFKNANGMLSAKDFTTLVSLNTNHKMLPKHTHQNLESVDEAYTDCQISLEDYANFHKVLDNFPAFEKALRMTSSVGGLGVGRSQLGRVMQQTAGTALSTNQLDVLFHVFDNPRRHSMLDVDTFLYVMKDRSNMRLFDIHTLNAATNNKTPLQKVLLAAKSFGIGAVAGAIGATAVYPIDLVKTRMQNQRGTTADAATAGKTMYKSSWDCFTQVIRNEGPTGLYRGLLPQLVGVAPEKAIKLVVNDLLRGLFQQSGQSDEDMYLPLEILAGGCAGMSQVVFTNPIEIVKIRLQVQGELATRFGVKPKGAVTIIRELGFFGLYKGAPACFSRDIPFSAIYFPLYAKSKQLMKDADTGEESAMNYLLAGSFAGLISASMTTPFDVVKTRLQVEARAGDQTYNGIVDCFVKVYRSEGILAFYKGVVPRCIRSSPQFGVTLLAYELLQNFFDPDHDIAPQPPTPAPVQTAARPSLIQSSDEDQMIGSWGLAPN